MARTKATVRYFPASARPVTRQRTIKPFKIKEILPQQKTKDIKKNGQIIKIIILKNILKNANLYLILIILRI